jgi:hypothetical protein
MLNDYRDKSSFDRIFRLDKFKKNDQVEEILDKVNELIVPIDNVLDGEHESKIKHTILITGAPRSGTTYFYQLMASRLKVGYVSNLMARFYLSPLFGAWLHKQLISFELSEIESFESMHGVTSRVYEPHEFGYFWARHFPFTSDNHEDIDVETFTNSLSVLEDTLSKIAGIFDKPVVYKCMIAPFVLDHILNHTSVFVVHLKRNPENTIESILKVRRDRLGDVEKWWSIRPASWADLATLDPRQQVTRQVELVIGAIDRARDKQVKRVVEVEYDKLVNNPQLTLEYVMNRYYDYVNESD